MTDNEIVKALDICGHLEGCADCPLGYLEGVDKCMHTLLLNALDLINRQKAEIERLSHKCDDCAGCTQWWCDCSIIESEAIKEFAERLKAEKFTHKNLGELVCVEDIDNLVKEMGGEQE